MKAITIDNVLLLESETKEEEKILRAIEIDLDTAMGEGICRTTAYSGKGFLEISEHLWPED